jgi:hypothetical protein
MRIAIATAIVARTHLCHHSQNGCCGKMHPASLAVLLASSFFLYFFCIYASQLGQGSDFISIFPCMQNLVVVDALKELNVM